MYILWESLYNLYIIIIYIFFEKLGTLNIQNYVYSLKNCIHLIYIELFVLFRNYVR